MAWRESEPAISENIQYRGAAWNTFSERALTILWPRWGMGLWGHERDEYTTLDVVKLADRFMMNRQVLIRHCRVSVAMQRLASEHLALAAFPRQGWAQDRQAAGFCHGVQSDDDRLKASRIGAGDAEAAEVLVFVNQRAFIRSTIPKMNDEASNKVPYLFYRYANQVAERTWHG